MNFKQRLALGAVGESLVAKWLAYKCGCYVLPVYEKEDSKDYKGPVMRMPSGKKVVAPDLSAFSGEQMFFFEAKRKEHFSWYYSKQVWQCGINLNHWEEYLAIASAIELPLIIGFLCFEEYHEGAPEPAPVGLYGQNMGNLLLDKDHECKPGERPEFPNGGIFWNLDKLELLAELDEILEMEKLP